MNVELRTKSNLLHNALREVFNDARPYPGRRFSLAMGACEVAFEHADALRSLVSAGFPTSAAALLRVQFEALIRAMWVLYGAKDVEIATLTEPLNEASQKASNKLPMAGEMLKILERDGPLAAVRPLMRFKTMSGGPLNSFIHSGVHSLQRHRDGFPSFLLDQILVSSNGLNMICGMLGAVLTGDASVIALVRRTQELFSEVLPPLEEEESTNVTGQLA